MSLHPLKAECPPGCKSFLFFFIENAAVTDIMSFFVVLFIILIFLQTNKQINCQVK